jgi:RNA polymerase sigma-70 factor, ECF subfamily
MEAILVDGVDRRACFEREVVMHLDALYTFAHRLTLDRHNAEDLVSDTVLRAFDNWESYRLGSNARAWLFTILYRVFISPRRRVGREVQLPDDGDAHSAFEIVDPEGAFYDSFIDEEITRAIDALPGELRSAVVLSVVHGLRYAEIASILGIAEGTVKSRFFRSRQALKKKLVRYATEMGYLTERSGRSE